MMLEFYKHGGRNPGNFDIFLHDDGRMSFDHRRPTKGYVRVIVELHEGRVEVTSTLDQGSTFSVYLPVAP